MMPAFASLITLTADTAMNRSLYTLLIVAAALLCACSHQEIHDFAPSDTPSGYLAVNLSWENAEDVGLSLTHFNIIVEGSNTTASAEFPTKQAVAQWLKQLPAGEYDVLVTAEMTPAAGYVLSGTTASLSDPASSPEQSWFSVAHVTIRANEITTAAFQLQRLMAFLSVNIRNVPDGVTLGLTADRVAGSVALMEKGADGRWGRPAADSTAVTLRHHTAVATRSVTQATGPWWDSTSPGPTATGSSACSTCRAWSRAITTTSTSPTATCRLTCGATSGISTTGRSA